MMLPKHAPLTRPGQFGTLEVIYPGRIDLGLGRAPGSDRQTRYALQRDPSSAANFPRDVLELQGYLTARSRGPSVDAIPGKELSVPLYILGSLSRTLPTSCSASHSPISRSNRVLPRGQIDALPGISGLLTPVTQLKRQHKANIDPGNFARMYASTITRPGRPSPMTRLAAQLLRVRPNCGRPP
jgi:hypothetical protein